MTSARYTIEVENTAGQMLQVIRLDCWRKVRRRAAALVIRGEVRVVVSDAETGGVWVYR